MNQFEIKILAFLGDHSGFLPLNFESEPAAIRKTLDMDRQSFIKATRSLMEKDNVELTENGVQLKVKETFSGAKFRKVKRKRR